MWGLVQDGSITKIINKPKGLVIGDVRYSRKIFELWSKAELEAKGIYEVEFDNSNKKTKNGISTPINHLLLLVEKLQQVMVQQQLKLMLILYLQHKMRQMEKVLKEKLKLED